MGKKKLANDSVSIKTRLKLNKDYLVFNFNTFGLAQNAIHNFKINATLANGENKLFKIDISKEMRRIPNGGLIIIDSIIEFPIISGGGFGGGTVEGWGDGDDIEIIM